MSEVVARTRLLEVRRVDNRGLGGRGVFARRDIKAGKILETCPVLVLPADELFGPDDGRRTPKLVWYSFDWRPITEKEHVALALGFGSLYNHATH